MLTGAFIPVAETNASSIVEKPTVAKTAQTWLPNGRLMSEVAARESWSNLALVRLNAFSFGVTGFILAMDAIILPVLVLTVAPEGLKNTYLAVLGFSGLLVAAAVQPVVGRLSDRTRSFLGRRVPFLILGTILACASLAGLRLAPNFLVLFGVWVFIQFSLNIAYGPALALVRDLVPVRRLGVASSVKIMSDAAGGMALTAVAGALIAKETAAGTLDWKWVTLALLGSSLIVTVTLTSVAALTQTRFEMPRRRQQRDQTKAPPVLNRDLVLFLVSRLLMFASIISFPTYGLFFLRDVVGVADPAQTLSRMILAIGGALVVMVFPGGWISDRVGRKPVIVVGATGAALSTLWMLTADSSAEVLLVATVIGASVGALLSANWALANELGSPDRAGLHMGIVNLATIGGALVAKVVGPGIDLLNRASENFGYQALITGCAVMFFVGAILLLPVKTTVADESGLEYQPPD